MEVISRRKLLAMLGMAPVAGVALAQAVEEQHAAHPHPGQKREWAATSARETLQKHFFPNVPLITHENKEVRFYDDVIKDRVVTINMMYASCKDLCLLTTANLVRVQKLLNQRGKRVGRDIFMVSITLDPEHDRPEVLKQFAKSQGVGPGWTFLTGAPKDIEFLRRSIGFQEADPVRDKNKANHSGNVRFGSEPLTRWAMFQGMANPKWIVEQIVTSVLV